MSKLGYSPRLKVSNWVCPSCYASTMGMSLLLCLNGGLLHPEHQQGGLTSPAVHGRGLTSLLPSMGGLMYLRASQQQRCPTYRPTEVHNGRECPKDVQHRITTMCITFPKLSTTFDKYLRTARIIDSGKAPTDVLSFIRGVEI